MRDFKRLMTEQGEDLFHKNMRKFGATVRESHKAYKDIKYCNIGGSGSGQSSPKWTGHADTEGLKAIGWTDEDIQYYQTYGVNWNEEDDEYHKVTEDNKALYGVLTVDNISDYRDRIVYLPKIDTSGMTDMSYAFSECKSMVAIPILDTSNIKSMFRAFEYCFSLVYLPPLDMSNVNDLNATFYYCTSLVTILSLDTSKTEELSYTFFDCKSLVSLPTLDISNVTNMYSCFDNCGNLRVISLKNTNNVTDIGYAFRGCNALVALYISDMSNIEDIDYAFDNCYSLTYLNLKKIKVSFSLADSALISKESLLDIINNEAATSYINIELKERVYNLRYDADIEAALDEHPNISLSMYSPTPDM